jgi:hypothetical protein
VGGEHELDAQLRHGGVQLLGRDAAPDQLAEGAAAIPWPGALGGGSRYVLRQRLCRAQAVVRLRDVGQHQEQGKGAGHRQGLADRQLGEHGAERFRRLFVPGASTFRERPNLFDTLVQ